MPPPSSYTPRNRKIICNVIIIGTYLLVGAIAALLLISLSMEYSVVTVALLAICGSAILYLGIAHWLTRHNQYYIVAYMLTGFYIALATGIIWQWSINVPIAPLLFGLVIVLAGILLTAKHALWATIASVAILMSVQSALALGWHIPDLSWTRATPHFGDALAYSTVFGMLALVSWLYNREMERSLTRAKQAEAQLLQQKASLEQQVQKRTAELRQAQLTEMRHMYRFTKMGQLGAILLHDLANHLTALTLEIEDLQHKQKSQDIARARQIIGYLENIVIATRDRLHGSQAKQTCNVIREISEAVNFLSYNASKVGVKLDWQPPDHSWRIAGDATSFAQILVILISNAIDAYGPAGNHIPDRRVAITAKQTNTHIIIAIADWGKGITPEQRHVLFKPFQSSKKTGMGLGLFIARQTLAMYFSGTLRLNARRKHTEFVITLPIKP